MRESIGIDLGMDSSSVAVVDGAGRLVARETLEMDRQTIRRQMRRHAGCRVVLEVGSDSAWVSRELRRLGLDVRCVNARRLRMVAESTLKTDELDAEVLARLARISVMDPALLPAVHHRSEQTQRERSVLKARGAMVRARTGLVSAARGLARTLGHPVRGGTPLHFPDRVRSAAIPPEVKAILEPVLEAITALSESIRAQERQAEALLEAHPEAELLTQVDGVGSLTALWFILCIEDPGRFARPRDAGAYFGFRPRVRWSSTTDRRGHITKEGDAEMRRLLVQAAHCLLRSSRDSALKRWGLALVGRVGRKRAIPAVARKLAVLLLRLWQTGSVYEPFPIAQQAAA